MTEKGISQAQALAEYLSGHIKCDQILSSDADRAIETARKIGSILRVKVARSPALREIDCGDWEGKPTEEVSLQYPQQWSMWQNNPLEFCFPRGESLKDVEQRVAPMLDKLISSTGNGRTVMLISHSATISVMSAYLHKWSLADAWQDGRGYHSNTAFSILHFDDTTGDLIESEIASQIHLKNLDTERQKQE